MHIHLLQLGRISYAEGLRIQADVVAARKAGTIGDTLILLEHPAVLTLGRNATRANILASDELLTQRGVEIHEINRGGDVTYHGPGQLVGYPIFDLRGDLPGKKGPHLGPVDFVRLMEEAIILSCKDFGVPTQRICKLTGVWTYPGGTVREKKIAAIGIHVSQAVTSHGFALNVTPDLRDFEWIVPCGITDRTVTSLELETTLEPPPTLTQVSNTVSANFGRVFQRQMIAVDSLDELLHPTMVAIESQLQHLPYQSVLIVTIPPPATRLPPYNPEVAPPALSTPRRSCLMPTDVVMPQMGESITEGTLTKWLKKPGDTVARDEPLFEISTDKVDAEIPSPAAGVLGAIKVEEGATVTVGTVVCAIEESGSAPAPAAPAAAKAETVTPAAVTTAATDTAIPAPAAAGPGTEVPMPQMGESITEGTLTKWLKKVGDTVARDEPIFEISTDKVDAEIPSPIAGTLTEIKVQEGQTVTVGSIVAVIGGGAAAPAAAAPTAPAPVAATPAPAAPAAAASTGETPRSSPLVRKIASENNIDLGAVPGTGASGRITKQDILGHLEGAPAPAAVTPAPAAVAPTPAPAKQAPAAPVSAPQPGELVPLSKMRSIIAKRMVESKATSPHVHTVFKIDMTRIVKLREKEKNKYEQRNGVKLTYMPFITRAAIQALRKHPIVNASMQGEAILYNKNINIGIAVALDWGLIVPVIKQTEEKSFLGIARSIVDVADRARNKKLAPDEVAGGTFTLTNSGIFGEQFGTPIIAQPQSAILGIGGMNKEAVVLTDKEGQDTIAIRTIQRFTLGFDHRTIDGADAGKFMTDFKNYLENWSEDIG